MKSHVAAARIKSHVPISYCRTGLPHSAYKCVLCVCVRILYNVHNNTNSLSNVPTTAIYTYRLFYLWWTANANIIWSLSSHTFILFSVFFFSVRVWCAWNQRSCENLPWIKKKLAGIEWHNIPFNDVWWALSIQRWCCWRRWPAYIACKRTHVHTNVYKFAGNISVIHKSGTTDICDEYAAAHTHT